MQIGRNVSCLATSDWLQNVEPFFFREKHKPLIPVNNEPLLVPHEPQGPTLGSRV